MNSGFLFRGPEVGIRIFLRNVTATYKVTHSHNGHSRNQSIGIYGPLPIIVFYAFRNVTYVVRIYMRSLFNF
jgi:hypothetical protein